MNIDVTYKMSYGRELFYPVSNDAKWLAELMERNSFKLKHLEKLVKSNWNVTVRGCPLTVDFFLIPKRDK